MVKVGLIGIGFMGRGHLDNYIRLEAEGFPVKLVAICDIDKDKFENKFLPGNINVGNKKYDFSKYNLYTDIDEMLENEDLDYVDITLPTYLHAEAAIKALNKGMHVLCEKPMALTVDECKAMIEAAEKNNRKLMIAQCLRFWPEYEYLKECVETNRFGKVLAGYFFRGGGTPKWSYQNWLLQKDKSGGAILDQHIHDVDMINWLFGTPKAVSTIAKNVIPGSGYDIVSTRYIYEDGKVITAEDDWVLNGEYGFSMLYRVNFEKGNVVYEKGTLKVNPNDGKSFTPDLPKENGYYREIKYFINALINDTPIDVASPYSTMETIRIAQAEIESADNGGKFVEL
ncbi:MAG: Gfo/Idh/MocA family oxidoreductase [Caldicoprobacter oshimai]|uniref:Predicted dehydrogenase n=1 Tax=Caldicoprobacter faecalis TaxID=937334 RepID=A0A1I5W000_9FIRM|nr:Gfo/Idh/MocA family oxidoreductase [Caldicoprobacter faecalis]PZN11499.1 MAG: gfo/Idh/MocA family oxidoreductase [Caldicoprobacter oshimai]SFQ13003.1 Predicted dehydrogenase [Caldicoprobacter faecalis]